MLRRYFFCFLLLLSLPFSAVHAANDCACTTELGDCFLPKFNPTPESDVACADACATKQGGNSKHSTYGDADTVKAHCDAIHSAYTSTPKEGTANSTPLITPTLSTDIPGINWSPAIRGSNYIETSFLADYINAVYRYLIGFGATVAIIILMIGGLRYVLAAGSGESKKGKEQIVRAAVGLILLMSVYIILYTVNPQLTLMKSIRLENVEEVEMPPPLLSEVQPDNESSANADGSQGTAEEVDDPKSHKSAPGPDKRLTNDDIRQAAQKAGVDECFLWSFAHKESGGRLHAIGHDENYPINNKPVNARRDFLMSGVKKSGARFTPPTAGQFEWKTMNSYGAYNDDKFNPAAPPNYGLDWRFSHGIGYLQLTIFPTKNNGMGKLIEGPNGPEWARRIRGKWYTVTDLLNADTALEASLRFVGPTCGKKATAVEAFKCTHVSNAATGRALAAYQKCPLKKTMTISAEDLKTYPTKSSH